MNRWLAKHLLWPASEWLCGRDTWRRWHELRSLESLTARELQWLQASRLRQLVYHAHKNCPFYRERFTNLHVGNLPPAEDAGGESDPLAWFREVPILTREDIREHREAMVWPAVRGRLIPYATGGSSGEPLQLYLDPPRAAADWAARWRARAWWGLGPGDVEVLLWGGPVRDGLRDRARRLRDRSLNQHILSAFDLSDTSMAEYVRRIGQLRPACVYGYAGSLALLARYALEEITAELPLHQPRLRAVFTTGEVLTAPDRHAIAAAFGVPVVQEYGCRDGGLLGCACPEGSLHVPQENVMVEIVDPQGQPVPPGEPGDVVITNFDTPGMPIIRYRNGDVAVMGTGPCRCGRNSQIITQVQGRRTDHIVRRCGANVVPMHALSLIYAVREVPGVRQFRIHQPALDRLEVDLVPGPRFTDDAQRRILSGLLERMGPGVQIDIRRLTHLQPLASGKHVCVTSDVKSNEGAAAAIALA